MDCALNGPNAENSHFSIFRTEERSNVWAAGKKAAEEYLAADGQATPHGDQLPILRTVHCSPLVWTAGPSMGGGGTAGGGPKDSIWWDGDCLLVIVELRGGGRDIAYLHVSADEDSVEFRDHNGDDWGWSSEDIAWFAKMEGCHFPPSVIDKENHDFEEPKEAEVAQ